ncbi:MAG: putative transrane anti-sigma factor [Caulobacter sp.]|nr:putative transrane anti-sigma factor [Caulobacter sp.]
MSACPDKELLLHGLLDGELDAANAVALEEHLKTCPGCADALRRLQALRDLLATPGARPAAPDGLRSRIEAALDAETPPARTPLRALTAARPPRRWLAGAGMAVAASLAVVAIAPQFSQPRLQDELVADHVRSLLAGHLIDVATSDRHTVKPWFNGRTDVAPPVMDLADQGFPLAGGRLDYVAGRVTPAVVYRRRQHVINLFVRQATGVSAGLPGDLAERRDGYSLVRWRRGGQEFWAVSDLDLGELKTFARLFAARAGP